MSQILFIYSTFPIMLEKKIYLNPNDRIPIVERMLEYLFYFYFSFFFNFTYRLIIRSSEILLYVIMKMYALRSCYPYVSLSPCFECLRSLLPLSLLCFYESCLWQVVSGPRLFICLPNIFVPCARLSHRTHTRVVHSIQYDPVFHMNSGKE